MDVQRKMGPGSKRKIITIIGSLNMDLVTVTDRVPVGGETLHATSFSTGAGGKGGNQAVATARLSKLALMSSFSYTVSHPDIAVKMVASVGDDEFGQTLIRGLNKDGIDTTGVKVVEQINSGIATIIVESTTGENRILLSTGANGTLQPSDFQTLDQLGTPLPDYIILQLEIPLPTVLQIADLAHSNSIPIIFNPAPAIPLPDTIYPRIHTLILNESEAALLSDLTLEEVSADNFNWATLATKFLQKGTQNVIITLGSRGAFFDNGESSGYVPAEKVDKVVDTTAAGDTFVGAYTVHLARLPPNQKPGRDQVILACRASGKTIQRSGAQSSIPWAGEVAGFY